MHTQPELCLHVPVTVRVDGEALCGELYLPKGARSIRLCVLHRESAITCSRLGSLLTNSHTATLALRSDEPVSSELVLGVADWVRSRRLLQTLAIRVVAPDCIRRYLHRANDGSARGTERRMLRIRSERQVLPAALAFTAVGRLEHTPEVALA